ncbi:MAG: hypothetical protein HOH61_16715 [Rhodospirillaceae bacterium]|nr:hypothetical protein [Rhodospirillaceae bacterium]MBT5897544.1 hypothetical protein [Rhodospirillaceae bacterium]MBT7029233.1 hypothetical protein [Rhodospirillaceae bacterium]
MTKKIEPVIAEHDPATPFLVVNNGARWHVARKFDCDSPMAIDLMTRARNLGLAPHGLAFHVGSQQCDPQQWDGAIARPPAYYI